MVGWLILAGYVVGWVVFVPVCARFVLDSDVTHRAPDKFERVTAVWLGMLLALFWPLFIPGLWFYRRVFAPKESD